ncbi:copper resistance CopC family protein [Nocardiopsis potens]|uniref:copper resistance CopC family protein n=1 Tax=Nocardiopsis potens TaxID=1246458 RepID=UPI0003480BEC|nr:copper resistance CopC family protein [Nocardiopsis potens]
MNDTTVKKPLRRGAVLAASLAAAGLLGLGGAPAALAHDTLLSSTPEADAELDRAPERIELTFSADIGDGGNAVVVNGPSGTNHAVGEPAVDGPDATVELDELTEAGDYTVAYRMVSSDGHVVEDDFSFTLTEDAVAGAEQDGASAEESPAAGDSAGDGGEQDAAAGGDASEAPVPSSDPVSLFGPVGGAVIGIALIALVAVVVLRLLRNRSGGSGGSGA